METIILLVAIASFWGAVWFLSNFFSYTAIIRRKLHNTKAANIAVCKDNEVVRLNGIVEKFESTLIAPLSKRSCVYYQVVIEVRKSSGRVNDWETLIHSERAVNFFLVEEESNEKAVISTHRVWQELSHQVVYKSGKLNETERKNFEHYLERHGQSSRGFLGSSKTMRYYESVLLPGDEVSVAGKALWKNGVQLGLPDKEKILYLKAIDQKTPLYLRNLSVSDTEELSY